MTVFESAARLPRKHPIFFHGAAALLVVVLALLVYGRTWEYSYLDWDDNTLVEQNVYVMNPEQFPTGDLWTPGRTPGPYQPIRTWSYLFDREVIAKGVKNHDEKGKTHHQVNTWLYVLNGLVLLLLLRKLLDPWTAAIATLIWVAHPVHVEAVSWVSGRKEMLSGLFMVGSVLAYVASTERMRKAMPAVGFQVASVALVLMGTVLAFRWVPLANRLGLGSASWTIGAGALLVVLLGVAAGGLPLRRQSPPGAFALSLLAFVLAVAGLLSKPVGVVLPPILVAWELGYRPLRDKVATWTGHTGFLVVSTLLVSGAASASAWFVSRKSPGAALGLATLVAAACVSVAIGLVAMFRRASPALQERLRAIVGRVVPTTEESVGMLTRTFPYIGLSLWGLFITVQRGATSSVIKEATWNAAAKNQLVSSLAAIWLDAYHLVAPLDLSALYDVKADAWHWQAYLGALILLALPAAAVWMFLRSPKVLIWLAWLVFPIVPVSGIIRIAAAHADRYLYLPAIALAVALAYLLATAAFGSDEETGIWERWMAAALSIAIVGGFTTLSTRRAEIWRSDVSVWKDAVDKNPELPAARNNYGAALMNAKRQEEALEQYYKAYEVLPTLDVAQFNIAATELRLGRPERSIRYAEEFVAQHPEMPTGWILLGQVYGANQQKAERGGDKSRRQEMMEKMEQAYAKGCAVPVSETQPLQLIDKGTACAHLGNIRHAMGNTTGGDAAFAEGLAVTPRNRNIFTMRAKVREIAKDFRGALEDLTAAFALGPTPEVVRAMVRVHLALDQKGQALEYLDMLLRSRNAQAGDVLLRRRIEEAIEQKTLVDLGPFSEDELRSLQPVKQLPR